MDIKLAVIIIYLIHGKSSVSNKCKYNEKQC